MMKKANSTSAFIKSLLVTFIISATLFFQLRSLAHLNSSGQIGSANGTHVLRDTLYRLHTFYFRKYRPISQLLLREPLSPFISYIERDDNETLDQLRGFQAEFENIKVNYYQNFSTIERTVVSDTADSIGYIIKDHELGWNLLSTSTFDLWQQMVESDKLVQTMGPDGAKRALTGLFLQTPMWHSQQIDRWRQAISDGWVMSQGGVERFIKSLKKKALKKEAYLAMIKSSSDEINIDNHLIIESLMQSSASLLSFLENEYLEASKKFRPYSNPGLGALGEKGLALYDHMIERQVTIYNTPEETAQLGKDLTKQIQQRMLKVAKKHYGFTSFSQVAELLVDRSSEISFFQNFNTKKVLEYLMAQKEIVLSAVDKEFSQLTVCDFEIELFESVGLAFYLPGKVDYSKKPNEEGFCVQKGKYFAGVPTTDPDAIFSYEKDDMSLLMHESVPGHHTQIEYMVEAYQMEELMGEGLQSMLSGGESGMSEGWGLYAEQLGFQMGLYSDDEPMREIRHHNNNILRSLRLVIDSELHTGLLDREQATQLMMKNGFSRAYAEEEVDRYSQGPGQALGYMRGRIILDELRETAVGLFNVSPSDFHHHALRYGTISLKQLRRNMIENFFTN